MDPANAPRERLVDLCRTEGGLPRNFLKPCLLLLLQERPDHGYRLIERLDELAFQESPSSIYRTLRQLERQGYVRSRWDTEEPGPPRRIYELNPQGGEMLRAWVQVVDENRAVLERYRSRFDALRESG